jgi:cell division protein ZapE
VLAKKRVKIQTAYKRKLVQLGFEHDPAQRAIVGAMQKLQDRIGENPGPLRRLRHFLQPAARPEAPRGLYLWGGVGRGKTFLMDLFFESLTIGDKRRVHFHRFMSEIHDRLKAAGGIRDPLDKVAGDLARESRVLCFDEFFVSDIGDAMILAGLLEGLFRRGVLLIATSNSAPGDLYRDGLQRARFLPAIALLETHTRVLHVAGDTDYRLRLLRSAGTYLCPAGSTADATLDRYFHDIAAGAWEDHSAIEVLGRGIRTRKRAKGVAWFDFRELCEGPRSAPDYIEIARRYQTVLLSDVPVLTAENENAARRFVNVVDEFYDRRVKLIVSAAAKPGSIYRGKRLALEFQRTASRLVEMQSSVYLHAAHLS